MQDVIEIVEQEFTFHRNGEPLFIGHPDRVRVYPALRIAAITDFKFGYLPVTNADSNAQLRAYSCMVSEKYDCDYYYGAIISPRCFPQVTSVVYSKADIALARKEIESIWDACHIPRARVHASPEGCRYCRAVLICSALKKIPLMLQRQLKLKDPVAVLQKMTPAKRSELLDMLKVAEAYIEEFKEASKALLAKEPEAIPNYRLRDGREVRKIINNIEAFRLLRDAGRIDAATFSSASRISIGSLETALRAFNDGMPKREADEIINRLLDSVICKTKNAASLERV